ncbi:hypothetical protein [Winogradskyella sp. Asnod2-B02-A]|uniref:hypothetical protein n=1 Tax=Winogradskyella sp. Asnod2-B02-A TaxID=3160583 RepID=UPI0038695F33
MAINYTTRNNPKKTDNKQGLGMKIIYFALNFLLVPFSSYQTFIGYEKFLGFIPAILIAIVSGLIFFGLNYTIMEKRIAGIPHKMLILGYLLPLGISFFGNFNAIYGAQMKGELVGSELAVYSTALNNTYNSAISAMDKSTGLLDLKVNLDSELEQLRVQMEEQGPYNGYGKAAKKKWTDINNLFENYNIKYLDHSIGELTKVQNTTKFNNFKKTAISYYNSIEKAKQAELNKVFDPIKSKYKIVNDQYDSMVKNDSVKVLGFQMLEDLRKTNNEVIGNPVKGYLGSLTNKVDFNFNELKESDQRQVGTIKHSLESAFVKWENPTASIFASFFSLIIDLIPLGFLFLVFPYNSNKRKQIPTGPRRL